MIIFGVIFYTPCLRELVIEGCEELSSLPSVSKHKTSLERVKISGIPNLPSIPITPCLRELAIEGCEKLESFISFLPLVSFPLFPFLYFFHSLSTFGI